MYYEKERVLCKGGNESWWLWRSGVCQERRILDLLVDSSISGERSCEMIDQQTWAWWKQVEGKYTDDLRNEICWKVWYFMSLWRYFGSVIWRRLCVMEMILYWIRCSTLSNEGTWALGRIWECFGVYIFDVPGPQKQSENCIAKGWIFTINVAITKFKPPVGGGCIPSILSGSVLKSSY